MVMMMKKREMANGLSRRTQLAPILSWFIAGGVLNVTWVLLSNHTRDLYLSWTTQCLPKSRVNCPTDILCRCNLSHYLMGVCSILATSLPPDWSIVRRHIVKFFFFFFSFECWEKKITIFFVFKTIFEHLFLSFTYLGSFVLICFLFETLSKLVIFFNLPTKHSDRNSSTNVSNFFYLWLQLTVTII